MRRLEETANSAFRDEVATFGEWRLQHTKHLRTWHHHFIHSNYHFRRPPKPENIAAHQHLVTGSSLSHHDPTATFPGHPELAVKTTITAIHGYGICLLGDYERPSLAAMLPNGHLRDVEHEPG